MLRTALADEWRSGGTLPLRRHPIDGQPEPTAGPDPALREELKVRHYARRTVSSYVHWLRRFLRFHRMRHPREMGEAEINAFLSHLATEERVSASTQNQALAALLFLYRTVLGGDVGNLEGVIRARRRPRLPVVMTVDEVRAVLSHLGGAEALVAQLLYGSGLRLMEALRLRIKDLDVLSHHVVQWSMR